MNFISRLIYNASISLALSLWGITSAWAGEKISLNSYYFEPPYVTGIDKGLNYDLASYLTQISGGQYHFAAEVIPRKRLDRKLAANCDSMVVPWANRRWFSMADRKDYFWSNAYQKGASVIVTNISQPLHQYKGVESTLHLTLLGNLGHHYKGFDEHVKAGKLIRKDYPHYGTILNAIAHRPGIFTVISLTLTRYLTNKLGLEGKLSIAQPYHSVFTRHFLTCQKPSELNLFISKATKRMRTDPQWLKILGKYGLTDLAIK